MAGQCPIQWMLCHVVKPHFFTGLTQFLSIPGLIISSLLIQRQALIREIRILHPAGLALILKGLDDGQYAADKEFNLLLNICF